MKRRPRALPAPSELRLVDDAAHARAALGPLRRRVLESIAEPESAAGVARRLGLPRQKVNYHLRELERAGFVELALERKKRGCVERCFRRTARAFVLNPALLGAPAAAAAEPGAARAAADRFSSAYLVALASRLAHDVAALRERAAAARRPLATLAMQVDVAFASAQERAAFADELADAVAKLVRRHHHDSPGSRRYRFVVGGHPVSKSDPPESAERTP